MQPRHNLYDDPKLPQLGLVTDPVAMAQRLGEKFRPTLAQLDCQVESGAIERIQYRRGRRCRLLYRLKFRQRNGEKNDQWFAGKLLRPGQARRQYEEALAAGNLQNDLWPAVTLLPDLEMVIWTFPNDPEMPGLRYATDLNFVQAQINTNLAALGLTEDWRCASVSFERVKYMPGKRCVLRFQADLQKASGEKRQLTFYSKTYCDGMSRLHYQVVQQVYAHLGHAINIPRPIMHLDAANTLWQESWAGQPLLENLNAMDWEELFPRLAAGLARFHRSPCESLPPVNTLEQAYDSAQEDAQMLGWLLPEYHLRFAGILSKLTAAKEARSALAAPVTPIHCAIRLEQFVARGREVALVDFDAAALGDPLYDVAEFLASLQYLEFTTNFSRARLAAAATCFKASYAEHVQWEVLPARVAYYAVAALLSKMHDTMKNLDQRVMPKFAALWEIMDGWLQEL